MLFSVPILIYLWLLLDQTTKKFQHIRRVVKQKVYWAVASTHCYNVSRCGNKLKHHYYTLVMQFFLNALQLEIFADDDSSILQLVCYLYLLNAMLWIPIKDVILSNVIFYCTFVAVASSETCVSNQQYYCILYSCVYSEGISCIAAELGGIVKVWHFADNNNIVLYIWLLI